MSAVAEEIVDAGPTKTLADFTEFSRRALDTDLPESEKKQMVASVLSGTNSQLNIELIRDHGEHVAEAVRDVIYALTGVAVVYGLDLDQIVDAGVREYERREQASEVEREMLLGLAALFGIGTDDLGGDEGTLEL